LRTFEMQADIRVKPKARPRFYRGIAITDPATREFESAVKKMFRKMCPELFSGPLEVRLECYFKRPKKTEFSYPPKGDCDNMFKSVSDAGNDALWHDDSQIVKITCSKTWADEDGFKIIVREFVD